MKKLRRVGVLMIMTLAVQLSACGTQKELGDKYNEGSDYQYMFDNQFNMGIDRTYGKNGYYFMQGHYIYFMDDETHTLVPLCNKADCMHNEETDSSRYADCNAYVEDENSECIAYCNGYVYVLDGDGFDYTLYRIKADGSAREVVKAWDYDDGTLSHGMIHRDVFYYVKHEYYVEDGKFKETYKVMQYPLIGTNQEESIIYEQPDGIYLFSFSSIQAYGNHVYFTVQGNTTEGCVPYFSSVTFWNGKILLSLSDAGVELGEQQKLYIADLDGSNMEVFLEDAAYGDYYYSDGTNLYIANYAQVTRGIEEEEIFRVYDSDMNLVDTFTVPWSGTWNVGIGKEEGTYFWAYGDDDLDEDGETIVSMSLYFFDKSNIGSLNGEAFEYTEVAKWVASPADLN